MKNILFTFSLVSLITFSCSDVPDTKILCECYKEENQNIYENYEGKYHPSSSCVSEMTGLINESDKKFQMEKDGWPFNFSSPVMQGRNESDYFIDWQDSKIIARGEDSKYSSKVYLRLDRVNLKAYLFTEMEFAPRGPASLTGVNFQRNYQCKVVEGI